jgi:hypothetical protein
MLDSQSAVALPIALVANPSILLFIQATDANWSGREMIFTYDHDQTHVRSE